VPDARERSAADQGDDDLHGSAPESCPAALLIVDLLNDFSFEDGEALLRATLPAAARVAQLKERAHAAGVPVVYVNDNWGRWRSDLHGLVEHCLAPGGRGADVVRLLVPGPRDYFVLKPKHSGFFGTTLELLLQHLEARRLIVTGVQTDSCVLFTANDAYLRGYELHVPADCVAANPAARSAAALAYMKDRLGADVRESQALDLVELACAPRR
jgi:nicotinamidase-related amidase